MAKFKLAVAPTFKAKVAIPVHGGESVELNFEFKHRTRDQLSELMKGIEKRKDVDLMEDILAGLIKAGALRVENAGGQLLVMANVQFTTTSNGEPKHENRPSPGML